MKTCKPSDKLTSAHREFPYLEQVAGSKKSSHALASANLRKELARTFPGVKFSVTSKSYAGGCSIDVSWTDGPLQDEIDAIAQKYHHTNFDGMNDLASYVSTAWTEVFGSAGYVFASRRTSRALIQQAADQLGRGTLTFSEHGEIQGVDWETTQEIYRAARALTAVQS